MIRFSSGKIAGTRSMVQTTMTCPHCKKSFTFFFRCPLLCTHCRSELPNIAALVKSAKDKLVYHKLGETTGIDRTL